jgi:hypothetical protein
MIFRILSLTKDAENHPAQTFTGGPTGANSTIVA